MPRGVRATAMELTQAQIDIEYLKQIFGSINAASREVGISSSVLNKILNGNYESTLSSTCQRIRSAADAVEQSVTSGTTENKASSNGEKKGVMKHSRAAHTYLNHAIAELLNAATQAPAISALGFEHLAQRLEDLRAKYLDPIV
jgi:hypothetical protein